MSLPRTLHVAYDFHGEVVTSFAVQTGSPLEPHLAAEPEIAECVRLYTAALRDGSDVRIEAFVSRRPELGSGLVRALLQAEIAWRLGAERSIDWEDYRSRFPDAYRELCVADSITPPSCASPQPAGDTSNNASPDSVVASNREQAPLLRADPEQTCVEPLLAPLSLSDYALETRLGRGGQGEVYVARQLSLGRQVAIKLLHRLTNADSESERRFLREARTLAQTHHPQIVTIHGIGRAPDGALFLVMEFIEGADLSRQLAARTFDIREAVDITLQIARGIEHAHARGVIHRDLKPSNILWDTVRGPVVTDFGLAKDLRSEDALTVTDQMMGTPTYMAPEQAHRQFGEISEQTDVFGLAAILYSLLTQKPPTAPGPMGEVLQRLVSDEPIVDPRTWRPEIPPDLSAICLNGLAKYPRDRYRSVAELARHLQSWAAGEPFDDAPIDAVQQAMLEPTVVAPVEVELRTGLTAGARFGNYRLIEPLSQDPTRKVFRAEDQNGRAILLKCLPAEWLTDRLRRAQFRQEVLLSCSLSHPCLAKVVEAGTLDGTEFLAVELILGESVAEVLAREGPFSERRAIEILKPIADALHQIHGVGVIYRDLRPQNILLVEEGRPMLAEVRFGDQLAEHDNVTMSGQGDVTLKYIAPEVLVGRSSEVASDVYTLGATLYAMVTGHPPFEEERDVVNALIAKNAARVTPPRNYVADVGDEVCKLIADALRSNAAQRPAGAAEFAARLAACLPHARPAEDTGLLSEKFEPATADADDANLLHSVWDQLDPELQDAFSLAYNKKRRAGSKRISTRDLFEALARLGTGHLKQVLDELPPGAMPEPADPDIPIDRSLLTDRPLLSDCVRDSLSEFRKLTTDAALRSERFGAPPQRIAPVDLFVDVARHGHGPSVVRLREHGVDPAAMERIVEKLGLRLLHRAPHEAPLEPGGPATNFVCDENVQFSAYRPKAVRPETWEPLLAFAHLSALPADAPAGTPDPIVEVRRQAERVLGDRLPAFQSLVSDSSQSIPRGSELTFAPSGEGLEFNPPQRTFLWNEPVHREEFRFRAESSLNGTTARGRLSVYLGRLLIAQLSLVVQVDQDAAQSTTLATSGESRAGRFRRIFACVARADRVMVAEFQHYARLLQDTFLTSQLERLATGDVAPAPFDLIDSADVFQLYWSRQLLESPENEREWRYAISLKRPDFIRALYWEEPFPTHPERSLPPAELLSLGFQKIPERQTTAPISDSNKNPLQQKLARVRTPRSEATGNQASADNVAADRGSTVARSVAPAVKSPDSKPHSRRRASRPVWGRATEERSSRWSTRWPILTVATAILAVIVWWVMSR